MAALGSSSAATRLGAAAGTEIVLMRSSLGRCGPARLQARGADVTTRFDDYASRICDARQNARRRARRALCSYVILFGGKCNYLRRRLFVTVCDCTLRLRVSSSRFAREPA